MQSFTARNTNHLAALIYPAFEQKGIREESRNGPVLRLPNVTTVQITSPAERVHFCPVRNCNPFFHIFEAMAMFVPINDALFMSFFAKNMLNFVDEGEQGFNAFYGTRMNADNQFEKAIEHVRQDKSTRRAYVDLWDKADLSKISKDYACNLGMLFHCNADGSLGMTTFNRSNDAIWGYVSGANIVHFSFFQEYVALALGRPVGPWNHASANMHVYEDNPQWTKLREQYRHTNGDAQYAYEDGASSLPLAEDSADFAVFKDALEPFMMLARFVSSHHDNLSDVMAFKTTNAFISKVLKPMFIAWTMHKTRFPLNTILEVLANMPAGNDWRIASEQWMHRNHKAS